MQILIAKDGKQTGPFTEAQITEMLASGAVSRSDLAWHPGLTGWVTLEKILGSTAPSNPTGTVATVAPQLPTDLVLAERGTRLGAVALDCLIALFCIGPGALMVSLADRQSDAMTVIGAILLGIGFLGLLITQCYLLSTRGQTLGKRMVGVRVVKFADNSNPGFVGACLLRLIVPSIIGGLPLVGPVFSIIDFCFIFQADRRCLHDLIAGTKVVKV